MSEFISAALEEQNGTRTDGSSIAGVIASRILQLGDVALTVAEIAAVAGPGCSIGLVRDVSNLPAAEVARGFDELLDRRILREAGARAHYDYVFTHHLIAEAMYAGIDADLRARRHSRIAGRLESELQLNVPTPEREIARHHERAGESDAAAEWYVRAASAAAQIHAYGDAVDLAALALGLSPPLSVERAALDIRERAYGRRGERTLQRADIDALQRLAGTDPRQRFDVLMRRVLLARTLGESDEEGRLIAEMRSETQLDDRARAQALIQAATHSGLRSRPAEALGPAREALAIYECIGDVRGQLECLYVLVDQTANIGDLHASRAYLAQMHDRAANVADKVVEASASAVAAQAALLRADYRASYDLSVQALELQIQTNDRDGEAQSRGRCAVSAAWLGDFAIALRDFEAATETYASIGNKRGLALTYTNRTLLLMRLGLFEDAMTSIEQSNELFSVAHEERTVVANHVNASFVKLQLGDASAAKMLANAALGLARTIAFPIFEAAALANLGNAERALGRFDSAIGHMEAGIALRRPLQESRDFVDDLADLALAYVGAGRSADALSIASELCAIDDGSFESALWPHYPRWAVAQSFAAAGDFEGAVDSAARAHGDLRRFAERIDDQRARAGVLGGSDQRFDCHRGFGDARTFGGRRGLKSKRRIQRDLRFTGVSVKLRTPRVPTGPAGTPAARTASTLISMNVLGLALLLAQLGIPHLPGVPQLPSLPAVPNVPQLPSSVPLPPLIKAPPNTIEMTPANQLHQVPELDSFVPEQFSSLIDVPRNGGWVISARFPVRSS